MANEKILLVEDDFALAMGTEYTLKTEHYEVVHASDLKTARKCLQPDIDLVLLDVMLPDGNGYDFCREIREADNYVPVIFLTAVSDEVNLVQGLELGADDYVIKPFDSKELVARVRAVLRRFQVKQPSPSSSEKCVTYPDLTVNLTNYAVTYMGRQVDMPPKELELLYFLAASPNQVFTREQLLDHIWGYEYIGDTRTVDVHIKRLREKIKDNPHWSIATVWGIGYKFEVKNP